MTRTFIDLKQNGLPGVFIENTLPAKELVDMEKMFTPEECRVRADYLRPRCQSALPYIKRGESVMTEHGVMNKQDFDNDCVWLAVYDKVGNNLPIKWVSKEEAMRSVFGQIKDLQTS